MKPICRYLEKCNCKVEGKCTYDGSCYFKVKVDKKGKVEK